MAGLPAKIWDFFAETSNQKPFEPIHNKIKDLDNEPNQFLW